MNASVVLLALLSACCCIVPAEPRVESEAIGSSARPPDEDTQSLHEDWIRSDLKCIEKFRSAIRAPALTVEALVAAFGSLEAHADVDAGFGVRRTKMHLYGGYTTIWIEVLADTRGTDGRSHVAELRARQLGPRDEWSRLSERLARAWSHDATPIENGFSFVYCDEDLALTLRARTADGLGGAVGAEVPKELESVMGVLTSPFESVVLGRQYGDGGGPPPGRVEIEALLKAQRADLLRVVLRSIDPGARLYAAWALIVLAKVTPTAVDAAAIQTILSQKLEIQTSEGCEQIWRSPKEAFEFLERGG